MRKIMHISDLHFGRTDDAVVASLREIEQTLAPHLIAVSGDLTQRARKRQFIAAREFLDSLVAPKIIVPGNHDVPLYNVVARFLAPLQRYRQYVEDDLEPTFVDEEIVVACINTARSLTFKGGRINRDQVKRVIETFNSVPTELIRILVTHHPFDLPSSPNEDEVGRAEMAMESLRECMPDLLLAGHVHVHGAGTTAESYDLGNRSAIVVHAGTATSSRRRGAENSFNVIRIERSDIAIDRFDWIPGPNTFNLEATRYFSRRERKWVPADVPSPRSACRSEKKSGERAGL